MKKNIYINLFFTFILGILSFVSNKVFSNTMGSETLGLMRLFTQLIAYLNLVELGIASASTYALYKPIAEKNYKKINIIISTIDSFYKKVSLIIIILGVLSSYFINKLIGITPYGNYIYLFWMLFVINTALSYTFAKYTVLFTANQEYGFVRKVQGSSQLLSIVLRLLVLIYTQSFLFYILMMISQNIISYVFYRKHFKCNYQKIKKEKEKEKNIIKDMKDLFWHKIATLVVYNTDYILLSMYTSLKTIAIYSTYLIVCNMIATIVGILTPVLVPKIGKFIAENNKENIYLFWNKLHLLYLFLGTFIVNVYYYMFNDFIKLWMGEEYLLSNFTMILILINLYLQITRAMTEVFKENSGFYNDTYNPILESVINLVISFVLVQRIGLNGIIIGTIASNITVIYILKPLMVFIKCFNKNIKNYFCVYSKYLFLTILTTFISNKTISHFNISNEAGNWIMWVRVSIKISCIVGGITLLVFLLDKILRKEIIKVAKDLKIYKEKK